MRPDLSALSVRPARPWVVLLCCLPILLSKPSFANTFTDRAITSEYNWHLQGYQDGLARMNADRLQDGNGGSGVGIVHMELGAVYLGAEFDNGDPVFGDCRAPVGRPATVKQRNSFDAAGWAPKTASGGEPCRIKWVMCFGENKSSCDLESKHHASNAVNGLAQVAPEADLIVMQLNGMKPATYHAAANWLLTPNPAPPFNNQSPADHWNIVAVSASDSPRIRYELYWNIGGEKKTSNCPKWADGRCYYEISLRRGTIREKIEANFSNATRPGGPENGCQIGNSPGPTSQPDKYIQDWADAADLIKDEWPTSLVSDTWPKLAWGNSYVPRDLHYFATDSRRLRDAGIALFFAALNRMYEKKEVVDFDEAGMPVWEQIEGFVTPGGVGFPACLDEVFAVSGVRPDYDYEVDGDTPGDYISTSVHPVLTDIVAPFGATSYATPMAAAAYAVLKADVAADATVDETMDFLRQSDNPEAYAGFSCNKGEQDSFPSAYEHPSLACPKIFPDYSMPVLDLCAATAAATGRPCDVASKRSD